MTLPEQHTIDKLFRDLIRVYSTSATSVIGLDSFQTAIEELVCSDKQLVTEIIKLSDANVLNNYDEKYHIYDHEFGEYI